MFRRIREDDEREYLENLDLQNLDLQCSIFRSLHRLDFFFKNQRKHHLQKSEKSNLCKPSFKNQKNRTWVNNFSFPVNILGSANNFSFPVNTGWWWMFLLRFCVVFFSTIASISCQVYSISCPGSVFFKFLWISLIFLRKKMMKIICCSSMMKIILFFFIISL